MSIVKGLFLKKTNIIFSLFLIFIIINIIISPARFIQSAMDGISAWTFCVLPSVLPFMILTKLLSNLGTIEKVTNKFSTPMKKLYRTSSLSFFTFFMSILSGYPVGSKMVSDFYEDGKISRTDAFKMSSFCSNSGPMFIIGSVGIKMFNSATFGYILLISHILSALLNGLFYRNIKVREEMNEKVLKSEKNSDFASTIISSNQAILSVGAIIMFFFIVVECFNPVFNLFPPVISGTIKGVLEITKGCLELSNLSISPKIILPITSFVITFGGISTIMQSVTLLKKVKLKTSLFTLFKFTQGVISSLITLILCLFLI